MKLVYPSELAKSLLGDLGETIKKKLWRLHQKI